MTEEKTEKKKVPEAAKRALKEAEERREKELSTKKNRPKEYNGSAGPEPTRFGDWEKKGITSDF